jgi:hypothetical protein
MLSVRLNKPLSFRTLLKRMLATSERASKLVYKLYP